MVVDNGGRGYFWLNEVGKWSMIHESVALYFSHFY